MRSKLVSKMLCGVAVTAFAAAANAEVVHTFSSGDLAASATFSFNSDGNLEVKLENTSLVDVLDPIEVLTGVFFYLDGVTLTPMDAVLTDGSVVLFPQLADRVGVVDPTTGLDPWGGVSGEWGYSTDPAVGAAMPGTNSVISSAGIDLVGPHDLFIPDGADPDDYDLDAPTAPNGLNYGIVSAGDDPTTGNAPVTGDPNGDGNGVPLVKNGVLFTFGISNTFALAGIGNVFFNYGTDLNPIPIPGAVLLGALGLGAVGVTRRFLK